MRNTPRDNRQDLTGYSENELYMNVQNDEYLYNLWNRYVRRDDIEGLIEELKEFFIFSDAQEEELRTDFISETADHE